MEAEGARELPNGFEYLSVHCDISQLLLVSSPSEVQNVPVRGFLQAAHTNGLSCGNVGFLTSSGVQCWRGLCGNEEFEKALGELQLDTDPGITEPVLYGLKCSSKLRRARAD